LKKDTLWINLLESKRFTELSLYPEKLSEIITAQDPEWVVIDEVQRIPILLDTVHNHIEKSGTKFDLLNALRWGTLPRILSLAKEEERVLFLEAYVDTYFREEIVAEQIVRNLVPFRKFIEIAGQTNGTIVNYANIASDIGIDPKTVKSYFDILKDTLLGFYLPEYDRSLRRQQIKAPRFYLFDTGVTRALTNVAHIPLGSSNEIGRCFEHFIISQMVALNHYFGRRYKFSYLATKGGAEVDVIIDRPQKPTVLVEIKSAEHIDERHLQHLLGIKRDYPKLEYCCLCREAEVREVDGIKIMPWVEGMKYLGLTE